VYHHHVVTLQVSSSQFTDFCTVSIAHAGVAAPLSALLQEAGATPAIELAFTIADGLEYIRWTGPCVLCGLLGFLFLFVRLVLNRL
jgi:hypothetical protein